jgi:hypothetical protein
MPIPPAANQDGSARGPVDGITARVTWAESTEPGKHQTTRWHLHGVVAASATWIDRAPPADTVLSSHSIHQSRSVPRLSTKSMDPGTTHSRSVPLSTHALRNHRRNIRRRHRRDKAKKLRRIGTRRAALQTGRHVLTPWPGLLALGRRAIRAKKSSEVLLFLFQFTAPSMTWARAVPANSSLFFIFLHSLA